jgi:hypothetical protein
LKRIVSVIILALLLIGTLFLTCDICRVKAITNVVGIGTAFVYVDPQNITIGLDQTFDVYIEISCPDVIGFDVQLSWNTSILRYINHTTMIPVEKYSEGVLHSPVIVVKDDVNETGHMLGAADGTLFWVSAACLLPAPTFNGTGVISRITFKAVNLGECNIYFTVVICVNHNGTPPLWVTQRNGHVLVHVPYDVNNDGKVDILDIVKIANVYGSTRGEPNWNPEADVAPPHEVIDILDLVTCASHYGEKYP